MIDMEQKLYERIKFCISGWNEEDIYAISFFVYSNDVYEYRGFQNVSEFSISYNAESDCPDADDSDEERWNYAFWRQDVTSIINPDEPDELTELLFDWYAEQGIDNPGEESEEDAAYDADGNYIGKGPAGHYELLTLASNVARRLQTEGFIKEQFHKPLPIIVHGLEYAWYDIEATRNANPHGEANVFLNTMEEMGFI